MSKELEALEYIGNIYQYIEEGGYRLYDDDLIKNCAKKQFELLLKTFTPPTAEEVREALSDFCGEKIEYKDSIYSTIFYSYSEAFKMFVPVNIEVLIGNAFLKRRYDLVTLVGRFFESVKVADTDE